MGKVITWMPPTGSCKTRQDCDVEVVSASEPPMGVETTGEVVAILDAFKRRDRKMDAVAGSNQTPRGALASIACSGRPQYHSFDPNVGEVADPAQVIDLDHSAEILLCVYDKGAPEPVMTLVPNSDGTRTLLADGDAVARVSASRLDVCDVVLYQNSV